MYLESAKIGFWEGGDGLVRAEGKAGLAGINPFTGAVIPVNFDAVVPTLDDEAFFNSSVVNEPVRLHSRARNAGFEIE